MFSSFNHSKRHARFRGRGILRHVDRWHGAQFADVLLDLPQFRIRFIHDPADFKTNHFLIPSLNVAAAGKESTNRRD